MAHIALYRRFRPGNFDDVVGQDALIDTLRGQITNGRVNHAYLLCGPRGIGKTSVARILAKAINCESPQNGNFCGECSACIALNNQSNFDIIEIDAASNNGVDNIRDLRENIKFMPAAGNYRVYIIDEVHMLSISAFNALLKTLEEPPAHIVFIMATTEPSKLPITVLSRCQRFDFNRFKASDIVMLLKKVANEAGIKIEQKAIEAIARASEGGARDALSLLDQCNAFTVGEITGEHVSTILGSANRLMYFALADSILTQDTSRALRGFNKMLDDGCNTLSVARDLMAHFRDLFIAKHVKDVANTLSIDDVMATRLVSQASKASEGVLIRCIELFSTLESDLRYASHPRVFIELAIAKACRSENDKSYDSLLERVEKLENAISSGKIAIEQKVGESETNNKKKDNFEIDEEVDSTPLVDVSDDVIEDDILMQFGEPPLENENELPMNGEPPIEGNQEEYFPYKDKVKKTKIEEKKSTPSLLNEISKITKTKTESKDNNNIKNTKSNNKDAKSIWKKSIDIIRQQKKMSIVTAMKKAIPMSIDDGSIVIMYDENLAGLERLEDKVSARLINETLSNVAGKPLKIEIEHKVLDEAEVGFLDDVSKFPKDLVNKKN